ncbi:olfactory receptor 8G17-like [Pseudorasbora parva]|uniref:olfactory receptor 8G17-like n=1 Tax=Pseudorasbora parva TaxID=51549 RepID=UPI00351E7059
MDNLTFRYHILLVEGLHVTDLSNHLVFFLFLLPYIFITVSNIGILILISVEKGLHQPMHILYCNLPLNDLLGTTVILPRMMSHILTDPSERYITYVECAMQAFIGHVCATTSHTILMIMAFDRYVAICNPLRYPTIMSNNMVVKLSAGAWGSAIVLVGILIGLSVRLSHCRSVIQNLFCDNASLFKLSCENTDINNVYGLTFTAVLLTSSLGWVLLTYLRIARVCFQSKNKATNSKAIKTCSTHLAVYMIMMLSGFATILIHRIPVSYETKSASKIILHVIPPSLNPIIYGLQAKEIRQTLFKLIYKSKVNSM